MDFNFATSNLIIFGSGKVLEAGERAAELGRHAFVLTGKTSERAAPLLNRLEDSGIAVTLFSVDAEPTIQLAQHALREAMNSACDLVISMGGGSVLDTGKAVAALLTNGDDPLDFLEVIGRGKPLTNPSMPFIAIPTTAGTGSEVTRNAVLASEEHRVKVSLRSRGMLPTIALVDPELTFDLPPAITASTGLDALTQVIEPFLSIRRNPLTDSFCKEGIQRGAPAIQRAFHHGDDVPAREGMALMSLMGGLALANAGLGAVHGFAGPFGGMYHAPHGATCAALLPSVMEINHRALTDRAPDDEALKRLENLGVWLTNDPDEDALGGIRWLQQLLDEFEIPPLSHYGLKRGDFPALIAKAKESSSMKGNPIQLLDEELDEILEKAL